MKKKHLSDYLNENAWSQAELARRAGVSSGVIARALAGEPITRASANAIVAVLDEVEQARSTAIRPPHIKLASISGLSITKLQRKPRRGGRRHLLHSTPEREGEAVES